ncbi:MAG: alpha-glucosidase C-terminal domain-containing protein, partial [Bacteroidales bacterium]|nr:alpha-glucosidase C-terminal domain-containing protein [Bacteroidales bacterium]
KDSIDWHGPRAADWTDFYTTLVNMKRDNEALWNGEWGGRMVRINTNEQERVLAFIREKNGNRILNIMNLSNRPVTFTLEGDKFVGTYTEIISGIGNNFTTNSGSRQSFAANERMTLEPWAFQVFSNN